MECNDCNFYDVMDGICHKFKKYIHGYAPACDEFEQQTDTFDWEDTNE